MPFHNFDNVWYSPQSSSSSLIKVCACEAFTSIWYMFELDSEMSKLIAEWLANSSLDIMQCRKIEPSTRESIVINFINLICSLFVQWTSYNFILITVAVVVEKEIGTLNCWHNVSHFYLKHSLIFIALNDEKNVNM